MEIVWAQEPLPRSIFLAGPTPRSKNVPTWRPEALKLLHDLEFDGHVFIPEPDWLAGEEHSFDYDHQVEWEWAGLDRASTIVFWIPRVIATMPAFTTNIEFGLTVMSKKILLGYPEDAPKCTYMKALAERFGVPVFHHLAELMKAAVARC